jgi:transcriptional regulator with XRE-family HTH domain
MKDRDPTVRSHALGERLRKAMENAGYNGTQMADELGWSQGKVSRLLAGKRGGSDIDVSAFLAVCKVKGAERERLLRLSEEHTRPGWWVQHGSVVPSEISALIDLEAKMANLCEFQNLLVPSFLRTPEYARAVLCRSVNVPHEEIDDRVQALAARQEVLNQPRAPICTFFLHENVLRLPIGGPMVLADQLHHLLRVSVRSNVTIRVVPMRVGTHAGMAGSFTVLVVRNFKTVVYLENETSSIFLETPAEMQAYRGIVAALNETALDERHSRDLIGSAGQQFSAEAAT